MPDDQQLSLIEFVKEDISRLFVLVVALGAVGWWLGSIWLGVVAALLLFLIWQTRSLYQLYGWIRFNPNDRPPDLSGVWAALVYNVYRIQLSERRARDNLLNIMDRARISVSALEEAVVLVDSHGLLEWWNPAAERLLGFRTGDQGSHILNLIRMPDFARYFESDQSSEGIKLESWVQPNRFLQCEVTHFGQNDRLLIVYDITRLHQLEQMRKDFVDNISHELRTPLTVLSGYLETFLDQDDLNPRWRRGFGQMQQQTRRMTSLVNDLLLLSRLENEGIKTSTQLIDMPSLMGQLFADAEAYNNEHGHILNLEIDSHRNLLGSEKELSSAFGNLITNAIKYTPRGGTITVRWADQGEQAYFSVTDTGIGIDPQHIPRLTERFYRVDSGRSRETGGTGLGLAIVKHVLMQHGAHLEVVSAEGKGSTFKAVFPVARIHPEGQANR
ncbi:MAG: phosphate regulon sensor histidine kinase PhoR [Pseudomonadota bacterium]|nr:phosphate regulon sensor histidine kinase PhoR [Pseudomonadota bacterium]